MCICRLFTSADEGLGKGTLEGTCTRMCPQAEQEFRQRMRDIDSFEREVDGGPPNLAVKKFARNVGLILALNQPSPVLCKQMQPETLFCFGLRSTNTMQMKACGHALDIDKAAVNVCLWQQELLLCIKLSIQNTIQ